MAWSKTSVRWSRKLTRGTTPSEVRMWMSARCAKRPGQRCDRSFRRDFDTIISPAWLFHMLLIIRFAPHITCTDSSNDGCDGIAIVILIFSSLLHSYNSLPEQSSTTHPFSPATQRRLVGLKSIRTIILPQLQERRTRGGDHTSNGGHFSRDGSTCSRR